MAIPLLLLGLSPLPHSLPAQAPGVVVLSIGKFYRCMKCDRWHTQLADGYAVTADGVAPTCFHVLKPDSEKRDTYLIASDAEGNVYPMLEVLAANRGAEVALLRTAASGYRPLALNEGGASRNPRFLPEQPKRIAGVLQPGTCLPVLPSARRRQAARRLGLFACHNRLGGGLKQSRRARRIRERDRTCGFDAHPFVAR